MICIKKIDNKSILVKLLEYIKIVLIQNLCEPRKSVHIETDNLIHFWLQLQVSEIVSVSSENEKAT